jgi:hypothetical protein
MHAKYGTAQETTYPLSLWYLEVILRVPIAVEYDDGVGGGEIDAEAARPRRQQEAEVLRAGRVEVIDRVLAQLALYSAVQPLERESPQLCNRTKRGMKSAYIKALLRIRDVYSGSRIRMFSIPDPGSEFFDPGPEFFDPGYRISIK